MKTLILGIDEYALAFYDKLPDQEKNEVIAFSSWDFCKINEEIRSKPLWDLNEIRANYHQLKIYLAITTNKSLSWVIEKLHDIGVEKVYYVPLYILEKKLNPFANTRTENEKIQIINLKNAYLAHLETHIVDYCNLKCKACNNFAPFFSEGEVCSAEVYEKDLKRLSQKFQGILRIYLLGGEPLLQPKLLMSFLKISRKIFSFAEIRILTNGLLLDKMSDELFECIKDNDACMQITFYKPLENKIQKINNLLTERGIKYFISDEVKYFVKRLTLKPFENPEETERTCGSAGCTFLRDSKISKCPDAILSDRFDYAFGTTFKSKDDISLDTDINGYEIIRKINRPIDMCKYCTNRTELIPWASGGKEVEKNDWISKDKMEYYFEYNEKLMQENKLIMKKIENLESKISYLKGRTTWNRKSW